MPKIVPDDEYRIILDIVRSFPDGASVSQIDSLLPQKFPYRSLQRRLQSLVEQERLVREGMGRGSRYWWPSTNVVAEPPAEFLPLAQLPLSDTGKAIQLTVRGPLHSRKPVGYQRAFLDAYRPNETAYLSSDLRRQLARMGTGLAGDLPAGTYARHIYHRLLIDLSWNSSRLEGNTYSLLETERLLELGQSAVGKDAGEAQMILNHKAAIELLVENAAEIGFNSYTICNLHALLAENLLADPRAGGRVRDIAVQIGGTVYHPLEGPQAIRECFDQLLATATAINDPFEQAFFAMVHLPYLQPFEDVNKRVARFAANIPLISRNLCPLSFVDVPVRDYIDGILGVYEQNRIELLRDLFVWAYERSCARYAAVRHSLGEADPFRLRHRDFIRKVVGDLVRERMDRTAAINFIRRQVEDGVSPEDRGRLIEVVETEVMSLHEGNFARYRVRPSEFQAWREIWK